MGRNAAQEVYEQAEQLFISRNPKSKAIYDRATQSLPDGHEYVDLLGEFTAGLYGHSEPIITEAIFKAVQRGLSFGGQHEDEGKLAALVKERFPSMDLLRFTNSGTEANLMALSAAKHYTGKNKIMVMSGAYHGGVFIFKNGKIGPINAPYDYIMAKYNDISSVRTLLNENQGQVAAIIVEPMVGSGGAIPAERDFLKDLRRAATDAQALLIFDEVMTSRMHEGGGIQSQLLLDERPDLTTLGKYIGGGMSFGAFGGKRAIMDMFDPRKPDAVAHAGTFNNNVLTMSAGRAGLEQVFTPKRAAELHAAGEALRRSLNEAGQGTLMQVTGYGSILCFHFTRTSWRDIRSPQDLMEKDKTLGDLFHLFLLQKGYWVASQGFLALSLALTKDDLENFVAVVEEFLRSYKSLVEVVQKNEMTNGHSIAGGR